MTNSLFPNSPNKINFHVFGLIFRRQTSRHQSTLRSGLLSLVLKNYDKIYATPR